MALSWFHRLLKSNFRPAPRRQPLGRRPRLEALETREVPTVSVFINDGRLIVTPTDNANNTITVDHSGPNDGSGTTFVQANNGQFQSFADSSIPGGS
jgi:hypothetical protein